MTVYNSGNYLIYLCVNLVCSMCLRLSYCRPRQDRVPAKPREPWDLPESIWHHRAVLRLGGGRRSKHCSVGRRPAVQLCRRHAWRRPIIWLPVLTAFRFHSLH